MVYNVALLDANGKPQNIIEDYETMIWTERFQELGDFQIDFPYSRTLRSTFTPGTRLSMSASRCYMEVENTVVKDDQEGKTMLVVTGRSIEKVLLYRPNRVVFGASTPPPAKWELSGLPQNIISTIYNSICTTSNTTIPADRLSTYEFQIATPGLPNDLAFPVDSINVSMGFDSTYKSIMDIAKASNLGFGSRGLTGTDWVLSLYAGRDMTTGQTEMPPVVFAPALETLAAWSELRSSEDYRNVAYVFGKNGTRIVYANDEAMTATEDQRRVMHVDATDIETAAGTTLQNQLLLRGRAELQKRQPVVTLDGEVASNWATFGLDYETGDLVELRTYEGLTSKMRVIEKIYTADKNGETVFPTMVEDTFVTPGSWLSWPTHQVWQDVDPLLEWANASPDF